MKKIAYIFCLFFLGIQYNFASHNRAGEITYTAISSFEYEATIIVYTKYINSSSVVRTDQELDWGDGVTESLPRESFEEVEPGVRRSVYIGTHVYPGPGTYVMSAIDANRNADVINIPNSKEIPFYIESSLKIHSFLGANISVELLNPPLDHAALGQVYIHNPVAYDADGDSISYKLVACKGANGNPINNYTYPSSHPSGSNNNISVNASTTGSSGILIPCHSLR